MLCETIGTVQPLAGNVTNAEFAPRWCGTSCWLNMFDVQHPVINGLPETEPENTVRMLKKLTGRPIGINLEPVAEGEEGETDPIWKMSAGRRATVENALRAKELGVDFILLTGNPGMGVSNPAIIETLRKFKAAVGDSIVLAAGKMHAAGVLTEAAESILTEADIADFTAAGADIILLPAPGHGAGYHDGVRPHPHQLRTPSRRTDHHGHRHLAGGRRHRYHPTHRPDVQNGGHRHPSHR